MKLQRMTAILLSAMLTVSACLPTTGMQALAAEETGAQSTQEDLDGQEVLNEEEQDVPVSVETAAGETVDQEENDQEENDFEEPTEEEAADLEEEAEENEDASSAAPGEDESAASGEDASEGTPEKEMPDEDLDEDMEAAVDAEEDSAPAAESAAGDGTVTAPSQDTTPENILEDAPEEETVFEEPANGGADPEPQQNVSNYELYGSASVLDDGSVELTPCGGDYKGSAWLVDPVYTGNGLEATFSYWAGGHDPEQYGADGLVMMFSTTKGLGPEGGSWLGFIEGAVGVEFDPYYYEANDPEGKHIAIIDQNPLNHLKYTMDERVDDEQWHNVRILYQPGYMVVYVDGEEAVHAAHLTLPENVYFGGSASTGCYVNRHMISDLAVSEGVPADFPDTTGWDEEEQGQGGGNGENGEGNLHAWPVGHEWERDNTWQNITDWEGAENLKIGDTYTIQIEAETEDGNDPSFQWYDHDGGEIEGAVSSSYEAVMYADGWNCFTCIVSDAYGNQVEILCQIYARDNPRLRATTITLDSPGTATFMEDTRWVPFLFIPETDGIYTFYAVSEYNTHAILYDGEDEEIGWYDDGGDGENFKCTVKLYAGVEYILNVAEMNSEDCTCDVYVGKPSFAVIKEGEGEEITVFSGEEATMTVEAESVNPLTYTWYEGRNDWGDELQEIAGESGSSMTIVPDRGCYYSCRISDVANEGWRYFEIRVRTLRAWADGYDENKDERNQDITIEVPSGSAVPVHIDTEYSGSDTVTWRWYNVTDGHWDGYWEWIEDEDGNGYEEFIEEEWIDEEENEIEGNNTADYTTDSVNGPMHIRCRVTVENEYGESMEEVCLDFHLDIKNHLRAHPDGRGDSERSDRKYVAKGDEVELKTVISADDPDSVTCQWFDADNNPVEGADGDTFVINSIQEKTTYTCCVQDTYGNSVDILFKVFLLNDFEAAVPLTEGTPVQAEVTSEDPIAFFSFTPQEDGMYLFSSEGGEDTWGSLYDSGYEEITADDSNGEDQNFLISHFCTGGETYYLRANHFFYDPCTFTVSVEKADFYVTGDETQRIDLQADGIGQSVETTLSVDAFSVNDLYYQWYIGDGNDGGEAIADETSSFCTVTVSEQTRFSCHISDGSNEAWRYFDVYVRVDNHLQAWLLGYGECREEEDQCEYVDLNSGDAYTMAIEVSAEDPSGISYQWYDDGWNEIEGAVDSSYTTPPLYDGIWYNCVVRDQYGNQVTIRICFNVDNSGNEDNLRAWVEGDEEEREWADMTVTRGESAYLQVHAETQDGTEVTYQWYDYDYNELGCTGAAYETEPLYGYSTYCCSVQDHYGNVREIWFHISAETFDNELRAYPAGNDPENNDKYIDLEPGETATLTVEVSGRNLEGITYSWSNSTNPSLTEGETTNTLTTGISGYYYCDVTDKYGNSACAYFDVHVMNNIAIWSRGDEDRESWIEISAEMGQSYTLVVDTETEHGPLDLSWDKITRDYSSGGEQIEPSVGSGDTLETGPLTGSCQYRCTASDQYGNSATVYFNLNINNLAAHVYGTEDVGQIVDICPGGTATLRVEASAKDTSQLQYRWSHEGDDIEGADTDRIETGERGNYNCCVSDQYGNQVEVWFFIRWNHFRAYGNGTPQYDYDEDNYRRVTVANGEPAQLQVIVEADETDGLTYEWHYMQDYEWYDAEDVYTDTFTVEDTGPGNRAAYCYVTDKYGNNALVWFSIVTNHLSVYPTGGKPGDNSIEIVSDQNGDALLGIEVSADDMDNLQISWMDEYTGEELVPEQDGKSVKVHGPAEGDEGMHSYYCNVSDNYGNSISISFIVIWFGTRYAIVSGTMVDEHGNEVPGDMSGLDAYEHGREAMLTAPKVDGYNFLGWYTYTDEAPYYTGDPLETSREYFFNVWEDTDLAAVYKPLGKADITINGGESFTINGIQQTGEVRDRYYLGSTVTVETSGEYFAYWANSCGSVLTREMSYTFTVTGKETISAVFNTPPEENKATIVFETAYSQILAREDLGEGEGDDMEIPALPTRDGYKTIGWDMNGDEAYNEDTDTLDAAISRGLEDENRMAVVYAVYELKEVNFTVKVNGGTINDDTVTPGTDEGSYIYKQNEIVRAKANTPEEGMFFSHWVDADGTILSYNKNYSFFAEKDMTITAVFVEDAEKVEPLGTTSIVNMYQDTENSKLVFVSMSTVPNGCTINNAGIIATDDMDIAGSEDTFVADNARFVRGNASTSRAYRYTWSKGKVTDGDTWYVRAYLVYADKDGNTHIIYGDIVSQTYNSSAD